MEAWAQTVVEAIRLLAERCPRLVRSCYWAGTSSISVEELGHRRSLDIDLHTKRALQNVRPLLSEVRAGFRDAFRVIQVPDEFGSGFSGVLTLPDGHQVTLEVLANFEDVEERDLVPSRTVPRLQRVSLHRYLADKVQCVAERMEARDLVDIAAVLRTDERWRDTARRLLAEHDPLLLVERLLGWTDEEISRDLKAYPEVDPQQAAWTRGLLLGWLGRRPGREG